MRRCYQIALEGIPQSKWDLRDYMEMVRMWNLARGVPYRLVLDSDPRGMVVKDRESGKVLLGLTHDLLPYEVDEALQGMIQIDWDAATRLL